MMDDTIYHIKIKKEYVSAMLEDLQQTDAIEIIENETPGWQMAEVVKRRQAIKENPSLLISEEEFFKALESDD